MGHRCSGINNFITKLSSLTNKYLARREVTNYYNRPCKPSFRNLQIGQLTNMVKKTKQKCHKSNQSSSAPVSVLNQQNSKQPSSAPVSVINQKKSQQSSSAPVSVINQQKLQQSSSAPVSAVNKKKSKQPSSANAAPQGDAQSSQSAVKRGPVEFNVYLLLLLGAIGFIFFILSMYSLTTFLLGHAETSVVPVSVQNADRFLQWISRFIGIINNYLPLNVNLQGNFNGSDSVPSETEDLLLKFVLADVGVMFILLAYYMHYHMNPPHQKCISLAISILGWASWIWLLALCPTKIVFGQAFKTIKKNWSMAFNNPTKIVLCCTLFPTGLKWAC